MSHHDFLLTVGAKSVCARIGAIQMNKGDAAHLNVRPHYSFFLCSVSISSFLFLGLIKVDDPTREIFLASWKVHVSSKPLEENGRSWPPGTSASSTEMRGHRSSGILGNMDPDMHVRKTAEVPDERRTFDAPVVPLAVVAQIVLLIKCQAAGLQSTHAPQAMANLLLIFTAVRLKETAQNLVDGILLLARHVADRQPGKSALRSFEANIGFERHGEYRVGKDDSAVDASIDEAELRWQAYKNGKMKGIPIEEVFPNLAKKEKRNGKP